MALALTGCIGKNGGGINHYVGQEKLAPVDSWAAVMSGRDWQPTARLQQTPIWHYMNSDQWRYDGNHTDYNTVPENDLSGKHTADMIVKAVKNGWMPFIRNTIKVIRYFCRCRKTGATDIWVLLIM
jgi:nitrate reductase alpha subunit